MRSVDFDDTVNSSAPPTLQPMISLWTDGRPTAGSTLCPCCVRDLVRHLTLKDGRLACRENEAGAAWARRGAGDPGTSELQGEVRVAHDLGLNLSPRVFR
mmetsp:Transcript_56173/g.149950  ORF Transcript_56173/g.149950 Transcript_56173/m.149950 type:complete len:100 (+) Transcript_56173:1780-2079(+)